MKESGKWHMQKGMPHEKREREKKTVGKETEKVNDSMKVIQWRDRERRVENAK